MLFPDTYSLDFKRPELDGDLVVTVSSSGSFAFYMSDFGRATLYIGDSGLSYYTQKPDVLAATFTRSGGVLTSSADVDFGNAAADATVTHFAVFDAASSGNMLASAGLTGGSQSITTGTAVKFSSAALTISLD